MQLLESDGLKAANNTAGLQFVRAESHNVYLRVSAGVCEVIGVLHQRMEPSLHLPKD
jgi:hypothetical protein